MNVQHLAMQAVRRAIAETFKMTAKLGRALGGELQVWEVCQWPERECETVYLIGDSGNVVRIRVDGVPGERMEEFLKAEPGVQLMRMTPDGPVPVTEPLDPNTQVPDDASALLRGDLGL